MGSKSVLRAGDSVELLSYIINVTPELRENIDLPVQGQSILPIGKIILKEMNYPPNVTFDNFSTADRNMIIDQYTASVREKISSNGYGGK